MKDVYCSQCGEKLVDRIIGDEGLVPFCDKCKRVFFEQPSTCVLVLVINENHEIVLLRQDYVSRTNHVLVAGHVKTNETAEDAVYREVREEIGLEGLDIEYIKSYAYEKKEMLMLGYALRVKKSEFCISNEVDEAIWVSMTVAHDMLKGSSVAQRLLDEYLRKERIM